MIQAKTIFHEQAPDRLQIELLASSKKDRKLLRRIVDENLSKAGRMDFHVDARKNYAENVKGVTLHFFIG